MAHYTFVCLSGTNGEGAAGHLAVFLSFSPFLFSFASQNSSIFIGGFSLPGFDQVALPFYFWFFIIFLVWVSDVLESFGVCCSFYYVG